MPGRLIKGVQVDLDTASQQFTMSVLSGIFWFKVTERYPLDGSSRQYRRRDLRRGGVRWVGAMGWDEDGEGVGCRTEVACLAALLASSVILPAAVDAAAALHAWQHTLLLPPPLTAKLVHSCREAHGSPGGLPCHWRSADQVLMAGAPWWGGLRPLPPRRQPRCVCCTLSGGHLNPPACLPGGRVLQPAWRASQPVLPGHLPASLRCHTLHSAQQLPPLPLMLLSITVACCCRRPACGHAAQRGWPGCAVPPGVPPPEVAGRVPRAAGMPATWHHAMVKYRSSTQSSPPAWLPPYPLILIAQLCCRMLHILWVLTYRHT
jgi:hypothetical protein